MEILTPEKRLHIIRMLTELTEQGGGAILNDSLVAKLNDIVATGTDEGVKAAAQQLLNKVVSKAKEEVSDTSSS